MKLDVPQRTSDEAIKEVACKQIVAHNIKMSLFVRRGLSTLYKKDIFQSLYQPALKEQIFKLSLSLFIFDISF